jgi:hypothetical protein
MTMARAPHAKKGEESVPSWGLRRAATGVTVALLAAVVAAPLTPACSGTAVADAPPPDAGVPTRRVKLDLLFAIDNSPSMADKHAILAASLPRLLDRLLNPVCRTASGRGAAIGKSKGGDCRALPGWDASVEPEFAAVGDLHVGIVTSSLGARGGYAACVPRAPGVAPSQRHVDDGGRLVFRTKGAVTAIDGPPDATAAANGGFLAYRGDPDEPAPDIRAIRNADELVARLSDMIDGVGEFGCGFEAQLESVYRFLFQPDPYARVKVSPVEVGERQFVEQVGLDGVDTTVLEQRRRFLRPDSVVAVVMLTDENDSTADPLSVEVTNGVGHQWSSWFFDYGLTADPPRAAPLTNDRGPAPRGTSACETAPTSAACTSCLANPNDAACGGDRHARVPDGDAPNVRWFQPKRRFGYDPRFPLERYVNGFTSMKVPNRTTEHSRTQQYRLDDAAKACTNPVFAAELPDPAAMDPRQEIDGKLCNLPPGVRDPGRVVFALIGGVPWQLVSDTVDPATAKLKEELTASDWARILGSEPLGDALSGADPHMRESLVPRDGLAPPAATGNGPDPVHGREYVTANRDLQYVCTFDLPAPRLCSPLEVCDCGSTDTNPPLCRGAQQVKAKAYPTVRQLALARALSATDQSVVASICPVTLAGERDAPNFGYNGASDAIVRAIAARLRTAAR